MSGGDQSCDAGWVRDSTSTSCYLFVKTKKTWGNARADCRSKGGDLLVIGSKEEEVLIIAFSNNTSEPTR